MKLADVLQIVSLGAVATALFLNYWQARETGRQASEASKQVQLSSSILQQESYRQLTTYGANFNTVLFGANKDLLDWFLSSRGIPVGSHDENLRHMFMYVRMDVHEAIFTSHQSGHLAENAWGAWKNVIETDVATTEFRTVWRAVESHYIDEFAAFVTALIHEEDAATKQPIHEQ
ncbi:hypothetical protein ACNTMW_32450 [Planosporangium sp. 12N6]|uniref:hypothetical protein n=1 Tax=Planosporangium spinosum TaxID=3402278 RepID=UPI003CED81A8